MPLATFDQLSPSQNHKARHVPLLAPTTPPTLPKEPESTPRYDNVSAALFIKHDTAPPQEEVKVMQQSQAAAWKVLARRFKAAALSSRKSTRQTKALEVEPGRIRIVSGGKNSGDSPQIRLSR